MRNVKRIEKSEKVRDRGEVGGAQKVVVASGICPTGGVGNKEYRKKKN